MSLCKPWNGFTENFLFMIVFIDHLEVFIDH